jgi:hypothetical protein
VRFGGDISITALHLLEGKVSGVIEHLLVDIDCELLLVAILGFLFRKTGELSGGGTKKNATKKWAPLWKRRAFTRDCDTT